MNEWVQSNDSNRDNVKPLVVRACGRIDYQRAWDLQRETVKAVDKGEARETLFLLEHPPTYTIGSQRHPEHLLLSPDQLKAQGIQVYEIDRGGDITYHGPGQLVGYPIILLEGASLDLHGYLRRLEEVIIQYLASFGIEGSRKEDYTGVWIGDVKIAAIGVKFNRSRTRKGFITSHGFAFNIKKGIQHEGFSGIVPCGIQQYGVTSLEDMTGKTFTVEQVGEELLPYFESIFGYRHISEADSLR
ncbi:lipoyl(octanoyl) transferase LipB [Paenibacillus aquistagni]|uniref:Octanoyltransferase n=1 Tax=Paenibacillus aquistagni TaxID=1852522 RepID=A0A1X7JJQ3_9BACL|nr:lipoyl(octanoyl) transferase LipB [Paenibacillus aquistagni]NMM54517.1 lipoyl(octanoyl) transferase LipB [Paenibacillus aquistagni]SMG27797.1 lipoyl(octanoyl) transferase [Paenibacillus aquistagni]